MNITIQELGEAILNVREDIKHLLESGITEKSLINLLHDYSGVNKRQIRAVLSAIEKLSNPYERILATTKKNPGANLPERDPETLDRG